MKTLSKTNNIAYYTSDIFETCLSRVNSGNNGCNIVIPHVCNNINVFGAGFAHAITKRFPIVKENFHLLGNKAKLGYVQYVNIFKDKSYGHELTIANMISQNQTISHNNPRPLNYESLVKCMVDVRNYSHHIQQQTQNKIEIHCPKFGSGLAGGNWLFIENLIKDIWSDFYIYVHVIKK